MCCSHFCMQEGARTAETRDIVLRVCQQLANIVMDAAQESFEVSIRGMDQPEPTEEHVLKYGSFEKRVSLV